jgi:hypothetical protein
VIDSLRPCFPVSRRKGSFVSQENDDNMKSNRYTDTSPPPKPYDKIGGIHVLHGAVPVSEVEEHRFSSHFDSLSPQGPETQGFAYPWEGIDINRIFDKSDIIDVDMNEYYTFKPSIVSKESMHEHLRTEDPDIVSCFDLWWGKSSELWVGSYEDSSLFVFDLMMQIQNSGRVYLYNVSINRMYPENYDVGGHLGEIEDKDILDAIKKYLKWKNGKNDIYYNSHIRVLRGQEYLENEKNRLQFEDVEDDDEFYDEPTEDDGNLFEEIKEECEVAESHLKCLSRPDLWEVGLLENARRKYDEIKDNLMYFIENNMDYFYVDSVIREVIGLLVFEGKMEDAEKLFSRMSEGYDRDLVIKEYPELT